MGRYINADKSPVMSFACDTNTITADYDYLPAAQCMSFCQTQGTRCFLCSSHDTNDWPTVGMQSVDDTFSDGLGSPEIQQEVTKSLMENPKNQIESSRVDTRGKGLYVSEKKRSC